jgi:hypothetical protein
MTKRGQTLHEGTEGNGVNLDFDIKHQQEVE